MQQTTMTTPMTARRLIDSGAFLLASLLDELRQTHDSEDALRLVSKIQRTSALFDDELRRTLDVP